MKALIQRVLQAEVRIDGAIQGSIGPGLLVFLGVERDDNEAIADRLLQRVVRYRVFSDDEQHMNLNVLDIEGSLLVVSQFTLAADTQKGLRPSFSAAMSPAEAEPLYDYFVRETAQYVPVQQGKFGADMAVSLINDGPVTFLLAVS